MKFKVEFPNGRTEVVEQSDCDTVEQYVNTRFGRNVQTEAKVTLADEAVEEKPAKAPKAKK